MYFTIFKKGEKPTKLNNNEYCTGAGVKTVETLLNWTFILKLKIKIWQDWFAQTDYLGLCKQNVLCFHVQIIT